MFFEDLFTPDKIYITTAVLATLGLLLVSILIGITTRRRQRQLLEHCRYRPRKRLMEGAERRCFQLLCELFGHKFFIIPDVALSSLLNHKVGTQDRHAALHFIEHKTADFVLCNKRTLRPICVVKLKDDDLGKDPGDSPDDLKKYFQSAHLPFVYISKSKNITRQHIIDEFSRVIYETSKLKPFATTTSKSLTSTSKSLAPASKSLAPASKSSAPASKSSASANQSLTSTSKNSTSTSQSLTPTGQKSRTASPSHAKLTPRSTKSKAATPKITK